MKKTLFATLPLVALLALNTSCGDANNRTDGTAGEAVSDMDKAAEDGGVQADATVIDNNAGPTVTADTDSAGAAAAGPTAPHSTDPEFMQSAAHSDQNEIQLSKLALEKGVTGMVKDHANMMIKDHTKSTADLKPIAQKKNVTLPTDMDAEHKTIAADMRKLSGKDFEKKYMEQMLADHQKTFNTLQAHAQMTKDADLQGFIQKVTPVVQSHLNMFKQHAAM
ncbi:DUF4142 domain-containing protein [Hymenobacter lutimineralis]|uniref:DUF4142 domain-containing protein n=1 Tax=Hymenobacter lutimineralis TaxID=2606448 RepID=A0A5D6V644_9BACT|nr:MULTISPECIES: DUF4142 domain-containing protein [Hymenobacter]QIX61636.1 DUF4142 domain-containing protein [Hymenobacter sp. BT18]TYZ11353.1 DUF4142 domain-containing protein [Hymenobacter lutimineralis]